jgi:hypothetical protein
MDAHSADDRRRDLRLCGRELILPVHGAVDSLLWYDHDFPWTQDCAEGASDEQFSLPSNHRAVRRAYKDRLLDSAGAINCAAEPPALNPTPEINLRLAIAAPNRSAVDR